MQSRATTPRRRRCPTEYRTPYRSGWSSGLNVWSGVEITAGRSLFAESVSTDGAFDGEDPRPPSIMISKDLGIASIGWTSTVIERHVADC